MALDGLLLHNIQNHINKMIPCKIGKIQNISEEEIQFHFHVPSYGNQKCIVNVHSNTNRIYLTDSITNTQKTPSNFVMVLRKNISQGTIESIEQIGFDRIICFSIVNRNEFQDLVHFKLYIELMGKYANIILVNENNIIVDALKRIPVYENSKRLIHPGALYTLPDAGKKMNPLQVQKIDLDQSLVKQIHGFSPLLSNEFIYRIKFLNESYDDIIQELIQSNTLYVYEKDFHCIELKHLKQNAKTYNLMSGLSILYSENETRIRLKEQCGDVFKCVQKEKNKNIKKLPKLKKSLSDSHDYQKYQVYGDLLFCYMNQIKKEPIVTLPSFENNEEVNIPIDMRYDLKDNANKYYQKYHKLKRSLSILQEQIDACENEIQYYTQLEEQLMHCSIEDALEIQEELIVKKVLKPKNKVNSKKKKKPNILHLHFNDSDIFVGKNNIQNNYITHTLARKQDLWFHVKDYHGSHVLLKSETYNEENIRLCAKLAAYYSKGKDSSSVPVDYCLVSQLKKIPGAPMGLVSMKSYKTIYIDPSSKEIEDIIKAYQVR
ncbi:Rqc2 family fibronectin-binding protein [Floccifex sp.]|uniref:Rqc2 family fibronectin-binding protein n=1 Tax=Floccifex sp. TaxID=2815810 RepID=UPI002A75C467|nr:NFACT RNA binding domain-containing protein [Floccifex sp.]MDD7281149.1 NFACT RNA binding domain-containing protein [Erysipelotrichaceae bacterium]MDY2958051.1 NFACT RNA binding domain-containing protein [Floccifex sp.]